jgi:hypothetical protein
MTQQIYLGLPSPYAHEIAAAVGGLAQAGNQQPIAEPLCGDGAAEL